MAVTTDQVKAAGRHAVSFVMGAIAFAGATHLITADEANTVTTSVTQISTSLATLMTAVASLVTFGMGFWAQLSSKPAAQLAAVAASPDVEKVVMKTPELAAAIPSEKVVSQ